MTVLIFYIICNFENDLDMSICLFYTFQFMICIMFCFAEIVSQMETVMGDYIESRVGAKVPRRSPARGGTAKTQVQDSSPANHLQLFPSF